MKKPVLHPNTLAFLERRGVESIRAAMIGAASMDHTGMPSPPEDQIIMVIRPTDIGSVSLTRAEAETWLQWKAEQDDRMIRISVWAYVIAAVASIIAIGLGVLAWLRPISGLPGH